MDKETSERIYQKYLKKVQQRLDEACVPPPMGGAIMTVLSNAGHILEKEMSKMGLCELEFLRGMEAVLRSMTEETEERRKIMEKEHPRHEGEEEHAEL